MHDGKDHIDASRLSTFTETNQRAASAGVRWIWRQHDFRRVLENGQRFFSFQQRNIVEKPASLLVDGDRHNLEAVAIQVIDDGGG